MTLTEADIDFLQDLFPDATVSEMDELIDTVESVFGNYAGTSIQTGWRQDLKNAADGFGGNISNTITGLLEQDGMQ